MTHAEIEELTERLVHACRHAALGLEYDAMRRCVDDRLRAELGRTPTRDECRALLKPLMKTNANARIAEVIKVRELVWRTMRPDHGPTTEMMLTGRGFPTEADHRAARERFSAAMAEYRAAPLSSARGCG